jgi:hypothetical protein
MLLLARQTECGPKIRRQRSEGSLPGNGFGELYDDIEMRQRVVMISKCLTKDPFDPIAVDRPPGLSLSDNQSQASEISFGSHCVDPKWAAAQV